MTSRTLVRDPAKGLSCQPVVLGLHGRTADVVDPLRFPVLVPGGAATFV